MPLLSRRNLLKAGVGVGAYGAGIALASRFGVASSPAPLLLEAKGTEAILDGTHVTKGMMTYAKADAPSANIPPVLRLRRGEPFVARFTNRLDEPTTVHWHGLRVPNRMDGVPFLTQPYLYKGDSFDYAFTPPDAGTFWYHPHCNTLTQIGRGMTGLLIVEDPKDPQFDAEITINLRDWRLGSDGQFIEQFRPRDTAKAGTNGTVRGANWRVEPSFDAPTGGLVRVRLAATDVTRIYALKLDGAEALVVALDGHPVPKIDRLETITIGPGQRLDLALRMPDSEGKTARLIDVRPSSAKTVANFRSVGTSLKRTLGDVTPLTPNPWQEPDLKSVERVPLILSATAENAPTQSICGTLGYTFWAINRVAWDGDTPDPMAPLVEMKLGKSYVFNLENNTPHAHPIHLHGMNFKVISSNARAVQPLITDTYLVLPDEKVQLALVADNVGDWVLHCHIIEHQKTGMTSFVRVI
ncbi:multicopper oxidase family protein [Rhizobium oryzicola]|uniref:Multicopper oxidase family protein n=1 Tax=Rhizobium oryzicola TaxID=1232668 RepID=A0ABT8SU06_9HYPH|nr:multicopper oxidase family protein [Rhizobium oryzicola]MDO1581750.1 multicopper oxidase family protein [Rhizobium oryzicola]